MNRCLIIFDIDTELLKQNYHNSNWTDWYGDIKRILEIHRFNNIQGTVYLSEIGVHQAHGTIALQQVAVRFSWFEKSVSNIKFYDLANAFDAQFIVDGIAHARDAFNNRIAQLRQQLIEAGLSLNKVEEIIEKQNFSLENVYEKMAN